jgi:hypothetical protein
MYSVHVHYAGDPVPRERDSFQAGADVLAAIPRLLERHGQCERIAVYNGVTFLFAVDCKGNRLES